MSCTKLESSSKKIFVWQGRDLENWKVFLQKKKFECIDNAKRISQSLLDNGQENFCPCLSCREGVHDYGSCHIGGNGKYHSSQRGKYSDWSLVKCLYQFIPLPHRVSVDQGFINIVPIVILKSCMPKRNGKRVVGFGCINIACLIMSKRIEIWHAWSLLEESPKAPKNFEVKSGKSLSRLCLDNASIWAFFQSWSIHRYQLFSHYHLNDACFITFVMDATIVPKNGRKEERKKIDFCSIHYENIIFGQTLDHDDKHIEIGFVRKLWLWRTRLHVLHPANIKDGHAYVYFVFWVSGAKP